MLPRSILLTEFLRRLTGLALESLAEIVAVRIADHLPDKLYAVIRIHKKASCMRDARLGQKRPGDKPMLRVNSRIKWCFETPMYSAISSTPYRYA